jgi:hypothetical protein
MNPIFAIDPVHLDRPLEESASFTDREDFDSPLVFKSEFNYRHMVSRCLLKVVYPVEYREDCRVDSAIARRWKW